jgi:hypothetical protein
MSNNEELTEEVAKAVGNAVSELFGLKAVGDRYYTNVGDKTLVGLGRTMHRFVDEAIVKSRERKVIIWVDNIGGMGPRDFDNLGTMACWHRRYTLGDEQPKESPDEHLNKVLGIEDQIDELRDLIDSYEYDEVEGPEKEIENAKKIEDAKKEISEIIHKAMELAVVLPLFLFDHSGLSMSTGSFGCQWDSGQVGYIYATPEDIRKAYSLGDDDPITDSILEQAKKCLEQEVAAYDCYLRGEIYGYRIVDGFGEEVDSCGGFYGDNWDTNGLKGHLPTELCDDTEWEHESS